MSPTTRFRPQPRSGWRRSARHGLLATLLFACGFLVALVLTDSIVAAAVAAVVISILAGLGLDLTARDFGLPGRYDVVPRPGRRRR